MPKQHEVLVEEAMEDWEKRGWDPNDFSLVKMIEVWEREDMTEMEKREATGHNELRRKQELIEASKAPVVDWDKWQKRLIRGGEAFQEKAAVAAFFVGRALELPPRRTARLWREHRQLMREQDDDTAMAQQLQREEPYSQLTRDKKYLDNEAKVYRLKQKTMQPVVEKRTREAKHAKEVQKQAADEAYEIKRQRWEFDDNERTRSRQEQAENKYQAQEK
jgi:hypothetical protein